jgi:hypothetical protein
VNTFEDRNDIDSSVSWLPTNFYLLPNTGSSSCPGLFSKLKPKSWLVVHLGLYSNRFDRNQGIIYLSSLDSAVTFRLAAPCITSCLETHYPETHLITNKLQTSSYSHTTVHEWVVFRRYPSSYLPMTTSQKPQMQWAIDSSFCTLHTAINDQRNCRYPMNAGTQYQIVLIDHHGCRRPLDHIKSSKQTLLSWEMER